MSLNLEFSIARTTLLAQESPDCKLVISNPGRDPVVVAPPVTNPDGEQQALPPGLANTRYPLELTFLGEAQVVIIAGQMFRGFKVMLDDGEHLPHHGA
jgi:hypothetical protein